MPRRLLHDPFGVHKRPHTKKPKLPRRVERDAPTLGLSLSPDLLDHFLSTGSFVMSPDCQLRSTDIHRHLTPDMVLRFVVMVDNAGKSRGECWPWLGRNVHARDGAYYQFHLLRLPTHSPRVLPQDFAYVLLKNRDFHGYLRHSAAPLTLDWPQLCVNPTHWLPRIDLLVSLSPSEIILITEELSPNSPDSERPSLCLSLD